MPACLWLLDRAQAKPRSIGSLGPIAQDLAAYKNFLDAISLQWDDFSSPDKYLRPTYLYRTHLQRVIDGGGLKRSTASRRMGAVVGLYRYLIESQVFVPAHAPWLESRYGLTYRDARGMKQAFEVVSTDVSIRAGARQDLGPGYIVDGGVLKPLSVNEQRILLSALNQLGNREYELMHLVALMTGAREQSVLTLRLKHFSEAPSTVRSWPFKLQCGPGTGIDTKRQVGGVFLSIPKLLYEQLHVYAKSERAMHRRSKSKRGQDLANYLFLTNQGSPYYESIEDRNETGDSTTYCRSSRIGQNLREFIVDRVVPLVRQSLPDFQYKFHDLRATYGVNWVDHVGGAEEAESSFLWAREELRQLMWHRSVETTDCYLKFRMRNRQLAKAEVDWSEHLTRLSDIG